MARNMINKAFIKDLHTKVDNGLTVDQLHTICESMFQLIIEKVKNGENVNFTNFIKFQRIVNKERTFRNPKNKTETTKPARYGISIKVMPNLRSAFESIPMVPSEEVPAPSKEVLSEEVPSEPVVKVPAKKAGVKKVAAAQA